MGNVIEKNLLTDFITSDIRIEFDDGDINDPNSNHWQNGLTRKGYIGEGNEFQEISFNLSEDSEESIQ